MNNQAAQTMPLPEPEVHDAAGFRRAYTADQMHQYARDYAASIAQTAWGAEPTLEMLNGGWRELERQGVDPELVEMRAVYDAMRAAAPAASGVHPDALPDGTLSKSTVKRVTALAAASVSERARELLAQACGVSPEAIGEYSDRDVMVRQALVAVESALTTVAAGDGETIDCEVAVAPASIFGIGVKLSTVVGAIRMRSSMEGTYAFTNKVREATSRPDTGGHALPGDDCPLCKAVGGLTDLRHSDGGHKRIHCAKCGKGSFGLHPIPGSTTAHPDALEQALTQQRGAAYAWEVRYKHVDGWSRVLVYKMPDMSMWSEGSTCQPLYTNPQPSADAVREVIGSMRNFADVADKCELTEGNAQVAIRAWATQLESLLSGGSHA